MARMIRKPLEELGKRSDLKILSADKCGDLVIMKKSDYVDQMVDLLNDADTYSWTYDGLAERKANTFKKEARRILSNSTRGKRLLYLLEEAPRPPRIRGLLKV